MNNMENNPYQRWWTEWCDRCSCQSEDWTPERTPACPLGEAGSGDFWQAGMSAAGRKRDWCRSTGEKDWVLWYPAEKNRSAASGWFFESDRRRFQGRQLWCWGEMQMREYRQKSLFNPVLGLAVCDKKNQDHIPLQKQQSGKKKEGQLPVHSVSLQIQ